MPRSYWLPIIAAIGLALAANIQAKPIGGNGHHYGDATHRESEVAASPQPPQTSGDIRRIAAALEAANAHPNANAEEQRAKDNLKAQQDMAKWARIMLFIAGTEIAITALGVVLVGFTLSAARRSAIAAEKSVKVTRNIGRAQSRAYLSAEGADMYTQALSGRITIHIKNTGDTPAQWVEVESNARLVEVGSKASDIRLNPRGTVQQWPLDPADGKEFTCTPDCGGITLNEMIERAVGEKKSVVFQGAVRWKTVFEETYESTFFFWRIAGFANIETNEKTRTYREIPQKMTCPCLTTPTYRRIARGGDGEKTAKHNSEKFWSHLMTTFRRS